MPPAFVATLPPSDALFSPGTHRIHETERRERGVELIEAHAGLHDRDVVLGVDLEDRVHALEREHDAVGARDARARQSGARAARGDRDLQLVTDAHDCGHLGGGSGPHDGERSHGSWPSAPHRACSRLRSASPNCDVLRRQHLQRAALPDPPSGLCRRRARAGQARASGTRQSCRRCGLAVGSASGDQARGRWNAHVPEHGSDGSSMSGEILDMPDATADPVVDALLRASRALVAITARSLSAVNEDVTLPQFRSLVVLATAGPQTVSALADRLAVHASTMTRMCNRLVDRGLVVRAPSAVDRREVVIALTDDGYISGRERDDRAAPRARRGRAAHGRRRPASRSSSRSNKFAQAAGEDPDRRTTHLGDASGRSTPGGIDEALRAPPARLRLRGARAALLGPHPRAPPRQAPQGVRRRSEHHAREARRRPGRPTTSAPIVGLEKTLAFNLSGPRAAHAVLEEPLARRRRPPRGRARRGDRRELRLVRRVQEAAHAVGRDRAGLGLGRALVGAARRAPVHRADLRPPGQHRSGRRAAARDRRVGARVLPAVREPPARLREGDLERARLRRRRAAASSSAVRGALVKP